MVFALVRSRPKPIFLGFYSDVYGTGSNYYSVTEPIFSDGIGVFAFTSSYLAIYKEGTSEVGS